MMPATPYAATTPDLLPYAHGQVVRLRATHPTWTGALDLSPKDWTLTFDEARAPRVELRATIPDDATLATLLDPRTGVRVELDLGYVTATGDEDAYLAADLGLRATRRVNGGGADVIELTAASDEALVIDASPQVLGSYTGTPVAIMTALLRASISPWPKLLVTATGGSSATVNPVTDRWSTIDDLADQIGADVYDPGTRYWVIEPRRTAVAATPDHTILLGVTGTMIGADVNLARDEWSNYVTLRYRWRSGTTDNQILATAYAADGPYAVTTAGKRSVILDRTTPTTQAAANAAAATLLGRYLTRGRTVTLSAISAYWLRPGSTIATALPGAAATTSYLVSSVVFRAGGSMVVTARAPETSPTIATTTPTTGAIDDPAGSTAQTYTSSWKASASKTYAANGTERTDTTNIVQGYTSTWGDQRALILFAAANSTGDETGKTITQALTGATVTKITVTLTNVHWYYNAGGTARLGHSVRTTLPATFASAPTPAVTASGWARYATRTIVITSPAAIAAFLAGTSRVVQLGPAGTTDQHYYGRFAGATETSPPVLTITYAK